MRTLARMILHLLRAKAMIQMQWMPIRILARMVLHLIQAKVTTPMQLIRIGIVARMIMHLLLEVHFTLTIIHEIL